MGRKIYDPPQILEFSKGSYAQCLGDGRIELEINEELSIAEAHRLRLWLDLAIKYAVTAQRELGH